LEDLVRFIYTGTIEVGKRRCRLLQKWLSRLGMELTLKMCPSIEEKNNSLSSETRAKTNAESTIVVRRASAGRSEKVCDVCEKTFKSESSLKAHKLNIHLGAYHVPWARPAPNSHASFQTPERTTAKNAERDFGTKKC
jgi:hypothetical protein